MPGGGQNMGSTLQFKVVHKYVVYRTYHRPYVDQERIWLWHLFYNISGGKFGRRSE